MSRWTLAAFVVAAVLLAGCGAAATPPGSEAEPFMVALPRIVIHVDAEGNFNAFGLTPALFGMDVRFPQPLLDTLIAADIQHLEIRTFGHGLTIFVRSVGTMRPCCKAPTWRRR